MDNNQNTLKSSKITELDTLAGCLGCLRAQGKRVVHCHGVFDLLHVGHIRHFAEAKQMGDVLVVTITPDEYVEKGPHRPAFPEGLRAEAVAALALVDYVAINRWPTAVEAIQLLRPAVYVKGPDYRDPAKDVTGGVTVEEAAVRLVGGELRITEDISFSSSNLLNRYLPAFPPETSEYIRRLREQFPVDQIHQYVNSLRGLKVAVVGEAILDEYVYCDALGKSAKEPILAMRYLSREKYAGGILAVANHVAGFCDEVQLLTYLGDSNPQEEFVRASLKPNVKPWFVYKTGSPTVVKTRYVEKYLVSKLLEIYDINDGPLNEREEKTMHQTLAKCLPKCDVAIVADFGHGLITTAVIDILSEKARFLAVNTQINAANIGFHTISRYKRADYVCIHEGELRLDNRSRKGDLRKLILDLSQRLSCSTVTVTRGKYGTLIYREGEGFFECPSFAVKVVDRVGAGDAVLALTSLCAATKVPADVIGFIGNMAGARAVAFVGNSASIDRVPLLKTIESVLK